MEFDDFIKSQQQTEEEIASPEKASELVQFFHKRIDELYAVVNTVLKPYIQEGSVILTLQERDIIEDELCGVVEYYYKLQEMVIQIGKSKVTLTPVGINIIGAMGRIDMNGPRGKAVILLARPGGPQVQTFIYSVNEKPPEPPVPTPKEELVWQFMIRVPRLHYIEVNEESFKNTLMQVING